MKYLFVATFFFVNNLCLMAQSPTFQQYLNLHHKVDNNAYDLKRSGTEGSNGLYRTNIFFNYYKNPNVRGTQKFDENMIFSVGYEFLLEVKIESDSANTFYFPAYTSKDKVNALQISFVEPQGSKEKKVKRKYYSIKHKEDSFRLVIDKEVLELGSVLKIYCDIESFYFQELIPFPAMPMSGSPSYVLSLNLPEFFRYNIPESVNLEVLESLSSKMHLKHFTYSSNPIVDYYANSRSINWELTSPEENKNLKLILLSIDLPIDVGSSVERILQYSQK